MEILSAMVQELHRSYLDTILFPFSCISILPLCKPHKTISLKRFQEKKMMLDILVIHDTVKKIEYPKDLNHRMQAMSKNLQLY